MNINIIQHVPFEGPGYIEDWAIRKEYKLQYTNLYENADFPNLNDVDCLVIMGGPMGIYEENKFHWLKTEKKYIETAIKKNKYVIGLCLGAQLISDVLGTKIYPGPHKEIGWWPVGKLDYGGSAKFINLIPRKFIAFHWHGETFDIPEGADHIFSSQAFPNQGFIYGTRVLAMQFHLEITPNGIQELITHCGSDLGDDIHIQPEKSELIDKAHTNTANALLDNILSNFIKTR